MQVCIDLFCLTQTYVDVATLGTLSYITSGQLYLYQPFKQDTHGDEFYNDLRWNVVRPQVCTLALPWLAFVTSPLFISPCPIV